eukprot:2540308-Rhodomonas_salina.1
MQTQVLESIDPDKWLPKLNKLGLDGLPDPEDLEHVEREMDQMMRAGMSLVNVTEEELYRHVPAFLPGMICVYI